MNRTKRSKQGFTLVELIVVIAILAILAGVAVPVYSGYIEKANEAADLQLLSAVNTAFGAACAGHGLDPTQVNATAQLDAEGHLVSVTPSALNADFLRYYGENVGVPFKVYTSLGYDRANGRFVNGATEISVAYGDGVVTVTMEQITAYNASTFGDMGSSVVLDEVNHVVNAAKNAMGQLSDPNNPAYAPYRAGLEQFLQENYGVSLDGLNEIQRSNALVLMVAHNAKDFDASALVNEFNTTGSMNSLMPELDDDINMLGSIATGTTIPYALALAYVNSGMAADDIATGRYISHVYSSEEEAIAAAEAMGVDPSTIRGRNGQYRFSTPEVLSAYDVFYNGCTWGMNTTLSSGEHLSGSSIAGAINMSTFDDVCDITSIILASDGFKSYMQSGQGEQDLNAFFTAMTMLDNNASNIDVNDLLTNGFGDEGLQEMIALVLGN